MTPAAPALRLRPPAEVTICIPTYKAEPFIARTLGFATGQTMQAVRILVGVDLSPDRTLEICRAAAVEDPRIEVLPSDVPLGWGGNTARLIEAVETPYFFLYFHDDFIAPQYCTKLRAALEAHPEAASANCTVALLNRWQTVNPAHRYDGPPALRILTALATDLIPGAPLRSLIRTERVDLSGQLRPGQGPEQGAQALGVVLALLLGGPTAAVAENLYTRWIRDDSLLNTARRPALPESMQVWQGTFAAIMPRLEAALAPGDLALVRHTLVLRAWHQTHVRTKVPLARIALAWARRPNLPDPGPPPALDGLPDGLARDLAALRAAVDPDRARDADG